MEPLIKCDVKTETVLAANQGFERHPEAYHPPVFFSVGEQHYELLQTGHAIPWMKLPTTFDYNHFKLSSLSQMHFERAPKPSRFDDEVGHSKEYYVSCLAWAKERGYQAMYNSMAEDGYDPSINWKELMHE